MSDPTREFLDALRNHHLQQPKTILMPATVLAVNEFDKTITVRFLADDIEMDDVRICAVVDNESEKLLVYPAIGSTVIVGNVFHEEEWLMLSASKVAKLNYRIGTLEFEVDQEGFKISKDVYNLKDLLINLIDQVKLITVGTPAGNSTSTIPLNSAAFDPVKSGLNSLLK